MSLDTSAPAPVPAPQGAEPGRRGRGGWWAALAGVVAAGGGLALAELVAAFVDPAAGPVLAGGAAVVDAVPGWLKDFAVETFGTHDKAVLLASMGVVLALGAALTGVLERRRPPVGAVLLGVVGVVAAVAAAARPGATVAWALPSLIGIGVAVPLLRALVRRVPVPAPGEPAGQGREHGQGTDRRQFILWSGMTVAAGVVALGISQAVAAGGRAVSAVREAITLPAAAKKAKAVPAGAELGIDGLDTYVTPNETFYRIDTALRVPQVTPDDWSLTVTGMVDEPFTLSWDDVLALPLEEHLVTLTCVSNQVGGDLIGNALWLGYPIRELLARAKPQAGADMVLSTSTDGFTAGSPLEVLLEEDRDCLLAVGMNGEPLPPEHGFPARLVVPGLYGYVSATKWVTELKVTKFSDDEGYWTPRGWSAMGPIKLSSRIDVPRPGDDLSVGKVTLAGVAWAQHTGISGVEVRVDDGEWMPAEVADTVGPDTWRQWRLDWDATPGDHMVAVRATDADGQVQTDEQAAPAPNGASGWHTIEVSIG